MRAAVYYRIKDIEIEAVIGHEITGVVEKMGPDVKDSEDIGKGDRVALGISIGFGKYKMCKRGFYNLCADTKVIGRAAFLRD